jgi:hypothetical protein
MDTFPFLPSCSCHRRSSYPPLRGPDELTPKCSSYFRSKPYVNGEANRDIMAKLYVSEATFHRTRRRALKAVTRELFEMGSSTK